MNSYFPSSQIDRTGIDRCRLGHMVQEEEADRCHSSDTEGRDGMEPVAVDHLKGLDQR